MKIGPLNQNIIISDKSAKAIYGNSGNSVGEKQSEDTVEISSKAHQLYASGLQQAGKIPKENKIDGERLSIIKQRISEDYYSMVQVRDKIATMLSDEPELIEAYNEVRENIQE